MKILNTKIIDDKTTQTVVMTDEGETFTLTKVTSPTPEGPVYAHYIPVTTKLVIMDENGTREIWQIGRWKRFKLWLAKIFGKLKDV